MRSLILVIFILQASISACACICPIAPIKEVRESSIKNSDLIFIGSVIESDTTNGSYKIEVQEVFKGQPKSVLISLRTDDPSSCAFWPSPFWGFEFIFYANSVNGTDRIVVDQCSATRSISNPQMHLAYFTGKYEKMQGILYKEMTFKEKIKFLKTENGLKETAFKDLIEELRLLQRLKTKHAG
jgi:hypothetical protein